jgi:hypothetical protein
VAYPCSSDGVVRRGGAAEHRHATGRGRMDSPTLQTLLSKKQSCCCFPGGRLSKRLGRGAFLQRRAAARHHALAHRRLVVHAQRRSDERPAAVAEDGLEQKRVLVHDSVEANQTLRGRRRMALERGTPPTLSQRACIPRYRATIVLQGRELSLPPESHPTTHAVPGRPSESAASTPALPQAAHPAPPV